MNLQWNQRNSHDNVIDEMKKVSLELECTRENHEIECMAVKLLEPLLKDVRNESIGKINELQRDKSFLHKDMEIDRATIKRLKVAKMQGLKKLVGSTNEMKI